MRNSVLLSTLILAPTLLPAADAPQWGQYGSRNPVSTEAPLPANCDPATGENIRWSAPLGTRSYATPVVAAGCVLVGTNNEKPRDPRRTGDRGVLLCLDEKNGSLKWQLVTPKRTAKLTDWPRTGICSSPIVDGDRVYLLSNRGRVLCLDLDGLADGNDGPFTDEAAWLTPEGGDEVPLGPLDADIIWTFDLAETGVHQHDAAHSSILAHRRLLYVNTCNGVSDSHFEIPRPNAPSLIVLDQGSGRWLARDHERMGHLTIHGTWSSPSVGEVNGRELIFFGGGDAKCYAFEPLVKALPPPEVAPLNRVWVFDCDPQAPKSDIMKWQDNRREGPSTIFSAPVFHEGRIYMAAGGDYWHGKPESWLSCIDASGTGDVTQTHGLWRYDMNRFIMASPAIHDGLAYIADCGKTIHCIDIRTGMAAWTHEVKAQHWASPLVADGKVYIANRSGELWVFAAGREKKHLATIDFKVPIDASPVAANRTLYITTMNRIWAVGE